MVRLANSCGPRGSGSDFVQERTKAVTRADRFAGNHVALRNEGFGIAAQIQVNVTAFDPLDDAVDQLAGTALVFFNHLRAFGFAYALNDDLLGGLRGNSAEAGVFHRLFDETTDLDLRIDLLGRSQE